MIINIILLTVIFAGTAGIFLCLKADNNIPNKKSPKITAKGNPKLKPLAIALLLIIAACTIAVLVRTASSDENDDQAVSEDLYYSRISGFMLGRHLARAFSGFNALIITLDKNSDNTLQDATLEGLREGLGGNVKIAAIDSPVPSPSKGKSPEGGKSSMSPERMLYLSRKMQSNDFDQLIAKHPDCNLIISLTGLPKDANKMAILSLKPEKRPKLALMSCNIGMMKERIFQGDISAAVINRPDYVPGKHKPTKDIESAFFRRYLLVTPDNVKQVASEYPAVFKK